MGWQFYCYIWEFRQLLSVKQAFTAFSLNGWEIKGGLFYNEIRFAGLSTTNGNLARIQNTRPAPTIRFSTRGYKPFPFAHKWLSFKGEYDEGFLNDERYVDGAHLHHKNLYFKFQTSSTFNFKIGFEHYVMWGGTSQNENIGELPEGWNAYWHYVFAIPGGEDFPETDQKNISGNQLGTYQFEVVKDFPKMNLTFYMSHPWEDNSGLNLHNWPDNLLGLHLNIKNEKKLVTDVVYEFTNTRQQSITDSIYSWNENTGKWKMNEYDNYYNHGIYRSGFTYQQQVMSSPLFYPVIQSNGYSMGIQSNRFFAHHIGVRGNFSDYFRWKGMLTYIQQLGTYSEPYTSKQKQVSGLFEVQYINPGFPVEIGLAAGTDGGNTIGKNLGFQLSVAKRW
ncbi:MAG TPA: capsule assembly Wzi family protein [Draconibacterium sp.]|nr:capsule assembly Wzi family protein [Draconibacterium sp.]